MEIVYIGIVVASAFGVTAIEYGPRSQLSFHELNCGNVCLQYTGNLIFFYSREKSSTAFRYEASDPAGRYRVSRNLVRVGIKVSELRTGFRCHSVTLTDFTIAPCAPSFRRYYSAVPNLCPLIPRCIDIILPNARYPKPFLVILVHWYIHAFIDQ